MQPWGTGMETVAISIIYMFCLSVTFMDVQIIQGITNKPCLLRIWLQRFITVRIHDARPDSISLQPTYTV